MRDSLGTFLEEIGRYPLLTPAQEIELSRQIKVMIDLREREDKSYTSTEQRALKIGMKAKEKLIRHNLRLVVHIARIFCSRTKYESLEISDFIQEGCLGLDRAAEMFDGTKGYKFSTYAYWWIKQALRRAADNKCRVIRLPVHATEKIYAIRRFTDQYKQRTGNMPSIAEVAEHIKMSEDWVKLLTHRVLETTSLDVRVGKDCDSSLASFIADPSTIDDDDRYETMELLDQADYLREALDRLPPREREVVAMRYGLDSDYRIKTLQEVGNHFGFCRERARQILNRATNNLRIQTRRLAEQNAISNTEPLAESFRAAA